MKYLPYKITATVLIVVFLFQPLRSSASINDIFKGWAWTPNIGWISINSVNTNADVGYGVTMDDSRNVFGWAWSSNFGWICFGSTCQGTTPDGTAGWAVLGGQTNPELHGWARVHSFYQLNSNSNEGWISLNCASAAGHPARNVCTSSNYYVYTNLTDGLFRGYGWSCTTVDGTAGCSNSSKYTGGIGWIRFDPIYTPPPILPPGTFAGVPWVQVLYGDLYAKGGLNTPSPFTTHFEQVNAYYCLDKGVGSTVSHFTQGNSSMCASGTVSVNINAPKQNTSYSNILGRIKLRGYSNSLSPLNITELSAGKYGPWEQVDNLSSDIPAVLGNKIFDTVVSGNWTINAKTFNNATGVGYGTGLIIVRGNLTINGDLLYQVAAITKLQHLASVGILVLDDGSGTKGNITIASNVTTISASIYAEGIISTGSTGNPTTDQSLTINGVVVAKKFNFERRFQGAVQKPSEKIVYDGRIVDNTPPGLNDFIASLPAISY